MVSAIILNYLTQGREARRDYWRRIIDFRRIGIGWYGVILLFIHILTIFVVLLDALWNGQGLRLNTTSNFLAKPLIILSSAIFVLFFGPVPEELGWRGYALDRLQAKWSALTSSLVLGIAWALWHWPLFLINRSYQNSLGLGSLESWLYLVAMIPESILMTWIYNHTQRSTLSAILFHFMINFNLVEDIFLMTEQTAIYKVVLRIVSATAVVIIWGTKTLTREKDV